MPVATNSNQIATCQSKAPCQPFQPDLFVPQNVEVEGHSVSEEDKDSEDLETAAFIDIDPISDDFDDDLFEPDDEESEEYLYADLLDDFDDISDFDEHPSHSFADSSAKPGTVTKEQRARQIAAELLSQVDWHPQYLELLQQIFTSSGWGQARAALLREIEKGATPEEIQVAYELKLWWAENEQYWINFNYVRSNFAGEQTGATYKNMSWPMALRLIRSFGDLPDFQEVLLLIDERFETWYTNSKLRKAFKSFSLYLGYRLGLVSRSLSGRSLYSFTSVDLTDSGMDDFQWLNSNSEYYQRLEQLGIELCMRPVQSEVKIMLDEGLFNER